MIIYYKDINYVEYILSTKCDDSVNREPITQTKNTWIAYNISIPWLRVTENILKILPRSSYKKKFKINIPKVHARYFGFSGYSVLFGNRANYGRIENYFVTTYIKSIQKKVWTTIDWKRCSKKGNTITNYLVVLIQLLNKFVRNIPIIFSHKFCLNITAWIGLCNF